jgi:hypothetical protein
MRWRILYHKWLGPFGYRIETTDPYANVAPWSYILWLAGPFGTLGTGKIVIRDPQLAVPFQVTIYRSWTSLVLVPWIWIHEKIHLYEAERKARISWIYLAPLLMHLSLVGLWFFPWYWSIGIFQIIAIQNLVCAVFTLPGDLAKVLGDKALARVQARAWRIFGGWTSG